MLTSNQDRLQISYLLELQYDGKDVIEGLSQQPKSLAPHYFYNEKGSQLFEQICELPEYYPTRTEGAILREYAVKIAQITGSCELVELGSGSSTKTRFLLDAYQSLDYPLFYLPIDVSKTILEESAQKLLIEDPALSIHGLVGTYELALEKLESSALPRRLICFLGSTLGNFNQQECDRFFREIKTALKEGDYFLLGIDLQKSPEIIEAAYNDSQGVTAAFNLNILTHLNELFEGNLNLDLFEHQAFYNQIKSQIEMHLVTKASHKVKLKNLDLEIEFTEGETILTEISRKFNLDEMRVYLAQNNLKVVHTFTDIQQWFGLLLCRFEPE
jgi:L-histidine N-alpha-methyltransferase